MSPRTSGGANENENIQKLSKPFWVNSAAINNAGPRLTHIGPTAVNIMLNWKDAALKHFYITGCHLPHPVWKPLPCAASQQVQSNLRWHREAPADVLQHAWDEAQRKQFHAKLSIAVSGPGFLENTGVWDRYLTQRFLPSEMESAAPRQQ